MSIITEEQYQEDETSIAEQLKDLREQVALLRNQSVPPNNVQQIPNQISSIVDNLKEKCNDIPDDYPFMSDEVKAKYIGLVSKTLKELTIFENQFSEEYDRKRLFSKNPQPSQPPPKKQTAAKPTTTNTKKTKTKTKKGKVATKPPNNNQNQNLGFVDNGTYSKPPENEINPQIDLTQQLIDENQRKIDEGLRHADNALDELNEQREAEVSIQARLEGIRLQERRGNSTITKMIDRAKYHRRMVLIILTVAIIIFLIVFLYYVFR